MICNVLESNFSIFFQDYQIKPQSDNFDNFDNFDKKIKSKLKIILSNKIIMPHEAYEDTFDFEKFKQKYLRRIDRFNNIVKNNNIKKIFVRADNTNISEFDKNQLYSCLKNYGCVNFEIKFINYNDYKVNGEFTWHRNYVDWNKLCRLE